VPFISENELERALVQAVKNPASAPGFYRLLLESDLLVMGTAEGQENATEEFTLGPGSKINLVTGTRNGDTFLPVFSSLLRMQEYVKRETKYLRVEGRALLDLTRGAPVILNPASEYGKQLTPQQVSQLLGPPVAHDQLPTRIGKDEYPMVLVATLNEVFAARPDIEAAWISQVKVAGRDLPHTLVGVEFDARTGGDWASLMQAIEEAAQRSLPSQVFDLQRIDRARPDRLTEAMLQIPPFYQRRRAGPDAN
jgi:hypothetical protein